MPRVPKPKWPALPRRAPGTGSLSRNQKTGEIRARLPLDLSPTRTTRKFRHDRAKDAIDWLNAEVTRLRRGGQHGPSTPFIDWAWHWYSTAIEPFRPATSHRSYRAAVNRARAFWAVPLDQIKPSLIRRELGALARTLAASTVQQTASFWRLCFEAAIEDELLLRNPVRSFKVEGERRSAHRKDERGWTAVEIRRLWGAIRGHRFEAAYALMLGCGIRIGEASGLAWADVDLEGGRAYLHRQWTSSQWRPTLKGRNPHWIPLPAPVVAALIRHRDAQPSGLAYVMENPETGRPWSHTAIRADWGALTGGLKLKDLANHAGRHGFASYLMDRGVPAPVVAALLGHATPVTTLGTYSHPADASMKRAVELIASLLEGGPDDESGAVSGPLGTTLGTTGSDPIESEGGSA